MGIRLMFQLKKNELDWEKLVMGGDVNVVREGSFPASKG
jgi:hypothetical protein